jgi:ABC-2 type transport system ATP-binding protein
MHRDLVSFFHRFEAAMSATPVVEFQNVSKVYVDPLNGRQGVTAVADASFTVAAGEVFALLGPNRSGKTTLVKLLLSLCRPTGGAIRRFGKPISDRSALARIGFMHENQHFPRYWTAAGLLEYYGALALVPSCQLAVRVPELLRQVGLADRSHEPISRFSKGMVQRLGLAQALINDPDLLVLDEPTEGLDLLGRQLLQRIIVNRKERGGTVLLVSHVLSEVEKVCDRAVVLFKGSVCFHGPLAQLLRDSVSKTRRTLEEALQPLYEEPVAI